MIRNCFVREEGQRLVEQGADKPLLDVWFANEQTGYVVGVFNLILRTEDGGQSWTPFQDRTDNPQGFHLNAIASTGDALYIAGEQGLLRKWDTASQRFAALQTPYQGSFFGVLGKPGEGYSIGTGLIVTTPVGPLRLEVASQDLTGNWRFNLGVGWKF